MTEFTTSCPYCGALLEYAEGESRLRCPACDHSFSIGEIGSAQPASRTSRLATAVDTPEAALAYLCSFFETADMESFAKGADLYLPELAEIAEVCKLRHANRAATWIFEFGSILIPLNHKLDALGSLAARIAEEISTDGGEALEAFDEYYNLLLRLKAEREHIFATLSRAVVNAEQYEADADELVGMKEELAALTARFDALPNLPQDVEELAEVAQKRAEERARVAAELRALGIDAEHAYGDACALLPTDGAAALEKLEPIVGYRNARDLIARINRCFHFAGLYRLAGRIFIVRKDRRDAEDEAAPAESAEEGESTVRGFSFFPVYGEEVSPKPILRGVTAVLAVYGDCIYYVYRNTALYVYDVKAATNTELEKSAVGDYVLGQSLSEVIYAADGKRVYIKKKLHYTESKASGCFASLRSLFSRKAPPNHDNNYALLCLDVRAAAISVAIGGIIDVMFAFRDRIFYKCSEDLEEGKKRILFRVYDTVSGAATEMLDEHSDIHAIEKETVVYSRWDPNDLNLHLHALHMPSGKDILLESNIYDVLRVADGRVYYTVGNAHSATLFSISLEGGDRRELLNNPSSIFAIRDHRIYVFRSYGRNHALISTSLYGDDTLLVCYGVKRIVRMVGGLVYYLDKSGALHAVRTDGEEDRVLAVGFDKSDVAARSIIIDRAHIYYLQKEFIGKVSVGMEMDGDVRYEEREAHSLYRMDLQGRNLRKIAFNVEEIAAYDENTIYLYKKENITYRVTTPKSKKKTIVTVRTYPITRYMVYDKVKDSLQTVYAEGSPEKETVQLSGCFLGKKRDRDVIYEELSTTLQYKTRGKKSAGAVDRENRTKK